MSPPNETNQAASPEDLAARRDRLRRSTLAVPGSNARMIEKAIGTDADVVFVDLEDAVAPGEKDGARANAIEALGQLDWGTSVRACRVNGLDTPWFLDDVSALIRGAGARLDLIVVPKVRSVRDVQFVDNLLTLLERSAGLAIGTVQLEILIEEVEAVVNVDSIACGSDRIASMVLGTGDLAASQGVRHSMLEHAGRDPLDLWGYALTRMVVAARAGGSDPIDGPYADFRDEAGFRRSASGAALLGAVGKWCIHPSQVPLANEVFSPSEAEIALAREVVDALDAAERAGQGAARAGSSMVDAATARRHRAVLERARRCGVPITTKGIT